MGEVDEVGSRGGRSAECGGGRSEALGGARK